MVRQREEWLGKLRDRLPPALHVAKCASRFNKPCGMAALALWAGFCSGYVKRVWKVDDPAVSQYFHGQPARRLLGQPSLLSLRTG